MRHENDQLVLKARLPPCTTTEARHLLLKSNVNLASHCQVKVSRKRLDTEEKFITPGLHRNVPYDAKLREKTGAMTKLKLIL